LTPPAGSATILLPTTLRGATLPMEEDPVCGMKVDPEQAPYKSEYRGKTYYFCSLSCKEQFEQEPEGYLVK
jgi:YHS domain-containing protein